MLVARNYPPGNLVRLLPGPVRTSVLREEISSSEALRTRLLGPEPCRDQVLPETHPEAVDHLYLFACQLEWERSADPSAAWEVISAARSSHADTRAHARSLLERPQADEAANSGKCPRCAGTPAKFDNGGRHENP